MTHLDKIKKRVKNKSEQIKHVEIKCKNAMFKIVTYVDNRLDLSS